MIAHPHKAKVADLRAEIARLEKVEADALRDAEAAYGAPLTAECAAEAFDARAEIDRLVDHLPTRH